MADDDVDEPIGARPAPDQLARAVAKARIAGKLFEKHEPVKLGRYHLLEQVGSGGMGVVWGAWDPELERRVAIKLVKATGEGAKERIQAEGQALAKLSHPNVVPVYDVGVVDDQVYLVMEWVRGKTLRAWAREATLREIIAAMRGAGDGLVAAHGAGLVHRDFKPDNAIVGDDGRVRVLDFGLARSEGELDGAAGTPKYMAPEQRDGRELTPAVDQFAFGVALRELVPEPTPRWIAAIVARATAEVPADRFASMADLLRALGRDPRTLWTRRLALAGVVGIAGGAFAVGIGFAGRTTAPGTSACDDSQELAATWTPERRAALSPITTRAIDAWTGRWVRERRSACEASHVAHAQSPTMFDLRIACLERARTALAASLDVVASGEVLPMRGVDVAATLPDVTECSDIAALALLPAQVVTPATRSADELVARATALGAAGNHAAAITVAKEAIELAEREHLPGHAVKARFQLAAAMYASGQRDVLELYEQATQLAAASRDTTLEVRAWMSLVDFVGLRLEKPDEASRLFIAIEAALVRAGNPKHLRMRVLALDADLALARHDLAIAIPMLEDYLSYEESLEVVTPDRARWYNRLATGLVQVARLDDAARTLAKGIALVEAEFGPDHPNIGVLLTTRGGIELTRGDHEIARASFLRALAIKEVSVGKDNPSLAPTLVNLALAEHELGLHAEALAAARRATALVETAFPAGHPRVAMVLAIRANMELGMGAYADAAATIERARAILEPRGDHEPLDEVFGTIAELARVRGDLAEARRAIDRAIAISLAAHGPSGETARMLARSARIAIEVGDRDRGLAGHRSAVAMAEEALGAKHPTTAELRRELATLDGRP